MAFTDTEGAFNSTIQTLLSRCLSVVVENISCHLEELECLPITIKDQLLRLLSKRGQITDTILLQLLHNNVRQLELSDCDSITDNSLQIIASKCAALRKIDLNAAKTNRVTISTQGVCSLAASCHQLQVVYLRRCSNITDAAVIDLSRYCPGLRDLNVGGCVQITDESLQALAQNSKYLRSLSISKSQITDGGVFTFCAGVGAKTLNELHLNSCTQITDDAIEAVVQMCPNIQLLLFHNCPQLTDNSRDSLTDLLGPQKKMKQITWSIAF